MKIRPWEFMVKDTPSRDWAEGMGKLIAVAFFCGGIAGGLYLIALYFDSLWGMLIGWIFALGMGLFDMAHLGKKTAAFRASSPLRPVRPILCSSQAHRRERTSHYEGPQSGMRSDQRRALGRSAERPHLRLR